MTVLLTLFITSAAAFEAQSFPLTDPASSVFLSPSEAGSASRLFIQAGRTLTGYPLDNARSQAQALLPDNVSAFDVADLDGDRVEEVIAVAGKRVLRLPFGTPGKAQAGTMLFEAAGVLSEDRSLPYLYPLVVMLSGRRFIALPQGRELVLHTASGEAVERFPLWSDEPRDAPWSDTFTANSSRSRTVGPEGAIEWWVSRRVEFAPGLPPEARAIGSAARPLRSALMSYGWERDGRPVHEWPWFAVHEADGETLRAYFAGAKKEGMDSLVALAKVKTDDEHAKPDDGVPQYRYPGVVIAPWAPPDFNDDGYADLLLWKAPEPGGSIESIVRTASSGTWPFTVSVHLFDPQKGRFNPKPASMVESHASVFDFLNQNPLDNAITRDLDGDGHADLALTPRNDRLDIWLYGEKGFSKKPTFSQDFPERIRQIQFVEDLSGTGRLSIGLRTKSALHILTPAGE